MKAASSEIRLCSTTLVDDDSRRSAAGEAGELEQAC
jgi:hypothetical protein